MRKGKFWLLIILLLVIAYLLGPHPSSPAYSTDLPELPGDLNLLTNFVQAKESLRKIKPDNEARIVWANDSARIPTPFSIVQQPSIFIIDGNIRG